MSTDEQDIIKAEKHAGICRKFLELRKEGISVRLAAAMLGKSASFFSGAESSVARFQRDGLEGLLPAQRDTSAMIRFQVPAWFIPAARLFYALSNYRRCKGSVPEAVRRTVELPALPFGWTEGQKEKFLKCLRLDALPECPPELRQEIHTREVHGKDLVPPRIARQIAIPEAIIQQLRSPRAFALDNLSAPGSQRRYTNANTGQREIMLAGDWFGGDDATPGIAVCVPVVRNEINTPCSEKFGVLIGRFQWLAYHDCRTDKILAFDYVVRPRGSYRAEDVLHGMGTVTRTHGIPRIGWQFEGGTWNAKLIRQAIDLLGCERWRTYSPHQKSIESIFNRVWTRLAVQFPNADMGRYRNANEANCRIYEACKRGGQDPRRFFPPLEHVIGVFQEEIAYHNSKLIVSRQYGQWVPDELFKSIVEKEPLRTFSHEMEWIFSPFSVERKIHGSVVSCKVPLFEDFAVPFDFSAPWMALHRGKKVRVHFDARQPKCRAKIVLLENSGTHKPGEILGDAELIGETGQRVRTILQWAEDDQGAGYRARQQTAHFLRRESRGIDIGRPGYSASELRDGFGNIVKIERGTIPALAVATTDAPKDEPAKPPVPDVDIFKGRAPLGKIGRLPDSVRTEVNQRLRDGWKLKDVAGWLNTLPEVEKVMAEQFGGRPVILENVAQWRKRGYPKWLRRREAFDARSRHLAKLEAIATQMHF